MSGALMIAAAATDLALRATILIGGAWLAAAALGRTGASAAARHSVWLLGISALLALPLLWWLTPALRLPILPGKAASVALSAAVRGAPAAPSAAAPNAAEGLQPAAWAGLLLLAYGAGALVLLLRFAIGRLTLARLWRAADRPEDASWDELLSRLSRQTGLSRTVELRIAGGPVMPMTWGTLAPKLLLPAEAARWTPERRRLVLLHELAHVARRDSLSRSAASIVCAFYWCHPGAWFAARRMRLEQEQAADDRVLTAGGSPRAYARSLLHLASGAGESLHPDLAATMAGMWQLERRLVSITGRARRDPPGVAFLSFAALAAMLATSVVAAAVPVSRSSALMETLTGRSPAAASQDAPAEANPGSLPIAGRAPAPTEEPARLGASRGEVAAATGKAVQQEGSGSARGGAATAADASSVKAVRGDAAQAPRYADLPDYAWQLQQRDSRPRVASLTAAERPDRLALPKAVEPPAAERGRRPKWAQLAPRLNLAGPASAAGPGSSGHTLMWSWSVDVPPGR